MKPITQVLLPIAVVAAIIYGVTFISNYTDAPKDKPAVAGPEGKPKGPPEPPLRFFTLDARTDPAVPHLKNFQMDYEVDAPGHFDYWFHNRNRKEVEVSLRGKNCQCAGAKLGVVPAEAWSDYLQRSAASVIPLVPVPTPLPAFAAADLAARVRWDDLSMESEADRKTVPAASETAGPQVGMVRVTWSGKGEGPKTIQAELIAGPPGEEGTSTSLVARTMVVPGFRVYVPGNVSDVRFGDLVANSVATREFFCWSSTRPELDLSLRLRQSQPEPCLSWETPQPLSDDELGVVVDHLGAQSQGLVRPRCVYRVRLTLRERCTVEEGGKKVEHHLDLGPFRQVLVAAAGSKGELNVPLTAFVRGDVRVGGRDDADRVDFGQTFAVNQSRTREVRIHSERPGLDLELVPGATTPAYLEATLTPYRSEVDGKKSWTLRVTIPAGRLFGSLPSDAAVVLQSKDASKRRIRIPVVAKTYDTGPGL